jgi:hypothetical protein
LITSSRSGKKLFEFGFDPFLNGHRCLKCLSVSGASKVDRLPLNFTANQRLGRAISKSQFLFRSANAP